MSISITPTSVTNGTVSEQTFTIPGLQAGDQVSAVTYNVAWTNLTSIASFRVSAANTLAITFANGTAGSLTPPAGTYLLEINRPEFLPLPANMAWPMSGTTLVYRPAGPPVALSVTASSHAAVSLSDSVNDQANYAACVNTGAVAVAVTISQTGVASTFPVDGTPGNAGSFVLPPAMQVPVVLPLAIGPQAFGQITAIGAAAGPSIIYVTPIIMQS
jgi:hypothetical protein